MSSAFTWYLQSNSPGELTAWLQPIAKAIRRQDPKSKIVVCLVPCPYATGQEQQVAEKMMLIDEVWLPEQTMRFIYRGLLRKRRGPGAVVFCGGEPLHAQLLGLRLGVPSYAYTDHKRLFAPGFKRVFYKHKVGDLMADRILHYKGDSREILKRYDLAHGATLLFFPGSRPKQFEILVGIWAQTMAAIKRQDPSIQSVLLVSPFISEAMLEQAKKDYDLSPFLIRRGLSLDLMQVSKLLVTIPGTNMMEATYMGLPMMMVLPLNRPDLLLFQGLAGVIGSLPVIGALFKTLIVEILKRGNQFYGLPNRLAKRNVVPEYVAVVEPNNMAKRILGLFKNEKQLRAIHKDLLSLKPKALVSELIVREILNQN